MAEKDVFQECQFEPFELPRNRRNKLPEKMIIKLPKKRGVKKIKKHEKIKI